MTDYDRQLLQNVVGVHIRAGHTRDEITYDVERVMMNTFQEHREYFDALMDGVELARKTA